MITFEQYINEAEDPETWANTNKYFKDRKWATYKKAHDYDPSLDKGHVAELGDRIRMGLGVSDALDWLIKKPYVPWTEQIPFKGDVKMGYTVRGAYNTPNTLSVPTRMQPDIPDLEELIGTTFPTASAPTAIPDPTS